MTVDIAPAVIEKETMLDFARLYDTIPLHTDEAYAKKHPLANSLHPVSCRLCRYGQKYLEVDFFGEELLAGKSTKIEWIQPVFAEDVLRGKATVTDRVKCSAKNGLTEITIEVHNQKSELVLTNVTEAIVRCKWEGE